jgi:DNA-binding response OmpR family regulator
MFFDVKHFQMKTINIAIIEKSPLAKVFLEYLLEKADFNVTVCTESIDYFLTKAIERSIDNPDICLLDSTVKISSINAIRKHYPEIKIAVYDPIATTRKKSTLRLEDFDVYMSRSLKLEQWITVLQNIVNHRDQSTA